MTQRQHRVRKEIPSWFSPYSKPYPPSKPRETIRQYNQLYSTTNLSKDTLVEVVHNYSSDQYDIDVITESDYDDGHTTTLIVYEITEIPNTSYPAQKEKYEEAYAEHKKKVDEWGEFKKLYDKKKEEEQKARDLKTLEQLKKKYESTL